MLLSKKISLKTNSKPTSPPIKPHPNNKITPAIKINPLQHKIPILLNNKVNNPSTAKPNPRTGRHVD